MSAPERPNFLLVGAAKSGTTSLYHYLGEHPDVFMPDDKEPNFFVRSLRTPEQDCGEVSRLEDYLALYTGSEHATARGDACVHNLYYHRVAIPEILEHLGDVRIIIALRDPVDRAWSQHSSIHRDQRFASFEDALAFEQAYRAPDGAEIPWSDRNYLYRSWGRYCEPVRAYVAAFSRVEIVLYDDLREDPAGVVRSLYRFLGVDDSFEPDLDARYNRSFSPRNEFVLRATDLYRRFRVGEALERAVGLVAGPVRAHRFKAHLFGRLTPILSSAPRMPPETRTRLRAEFRDEVRELERLIRRDLGAWLDEAEG